MKITSEAQIEAAPVDMEGAVGCTVRWMVDETDGAPNFAMRQFEVAPGGHTPKHHHPYEHEVYVLAGEGVVVDGDVERPLTAGNVIYVAPDDVHQFRNTGTQPMKFLCLVPHGTKRPPASAPEECARPGAS